MDIFDYLSKNCKEPFSPSAPLNEIDAVILSRFSYLPFEQIKFSDHTSVSEFAKKFKTVDLKYYIWPEDKKLITEMAKTKRYQNLLAFGFEKRADKKTVEQFSVISLLLPDGKICISYTGTDSTLNGWREDCNMAIMETIPAQKSAKKYLKTIAKSYSDLPIILVGHSKGGTLSMYAAATARTYIKKRIAAVYSFDGPGLSEKYSEKLSEFRQSKKPEIVAPIINYIPQDSFVGRMLEHAEKTEVVKSNAKLLFQHNVYSWEVNLKTQKLVRTNISKASNFAAQTIKKWAKKSTKKEKVAFTDLIFKIVEDSNVGTPNDMAKTGPSVVPKLLGSYRKLNKDERKAVAHMLRLFFTK